MNPRHLLPPKQRTPLAQIVGQVKPPQHVRSHAKRVAIGNSKPSTLAPVSGVTHRGYFIPQ